MSELGSDAAHPIPIIDDEENEVEDLLGDSSQGSSHAPGIRKTTSRTRPRRRTREETESQRQHRREKIASRIRPIYEDLQEIDMIDLTTDIFNKGHSKSVPLSTAVKRKSEFTIHHCIRVSLIGVSSLSRTRRPNPQQVRGFKIQFL